MSSLNKANKLLAYIPLISGELKEKTEMKICICILNEYYDHANDAEIDSLINELTRKYGELPATVDKKLLGEIIARNSQIEFGEMIYDSDCESWRSSSAAMSEWLAQYELRYTGFTHLWTIPHPSKLIESTLEFIEHIDEKPKELAHDIIRCYEELLSKDFDDDDMTKISDMMGVDDWEDWFMNMLVALFDETMSISKITDRLDRLWCELATYQYPRKIGSHRSDFLHKRDFARRLVCGELIAYANCFINSTADNKLPISARYDNDKRYDMSGERDLVDNWMYLHLMWIKYYNRVVDMLS